MSEQSWTCALHGVTTAGDCAKCDDELIALTVEEADRRPHCHRCGHVFAEGEDAWAEDWTVIADDYRSARRETRYTCDDCEGESDPVPHLYERDRSKVHVCTCGRPCEHPCHDAFRAYEPRRADS